MTGRLTDAERLHRATTEAEVLDLVLGAAHAGGWKIMRVSDSRRQAGGRWIGDQHTRGWPDVFAVRGSEMAAVECKTERGRFRPGQQEWLEALELAGVETYVARPSTVDEVVARLTRRR